MCDLNQNSKVITLTNGDIMVHSAQEPETTSKVVMRRKKGGAADDDIDLTVTTESLKGLDLLDGDRGDDTSTTSSGVSSGGSATLSTGSGSTATSPDKEKKKFDVSLTGWNIWQEDIEYAPDSDDDDEGISTSGLRRFREHRSFSTTSETAPKLKRFSSFLRRFSLRDEHDVSAPRRPQSESIELKARRRTPPKEIRVETLPQYFVVKHLGSRRGTGLFGLEHIRAPVDELMGAVGTLKRGEQLTLAQIHITKKGVHLSSHADNKGPVLPAEFVPLEFVSYGVQDPRHTRIFALILVRTVSRHAKKSECHAFACNCSATAKKLALAVGLAFEKYAAALKGQPHKFEVHLDKDKKPPKGHTKSEA